MEFSAERRVAAPRDFVFEQASDFTAFERQALRRGIEVESRGGPDPLGRGWAATLPVMGRSREITAEVTRFDAPRSYAVRGESSGLEIALRIAALAEEGAETDETGSRLSLAVELAPRSMPGRLVLQSLKLARGTLEARLEGRLEGYAREIEARWARCAG